MQGNRMQAGLCSLHILTFSPDLDAPTSTLVPVVLQVQQQKTAKKAVMAIRKYLR